MKKVEGYLKTVAKAREFMADGKHNNAQALLQVITCRFQLVRLPTAWSVSGICVPREHCAPDIAS